MRVEGVHTYEKNDIVAGCVKSVRRAMSDAVLNYLELPPSRSQYRSSYNIAAITYDQRSASAAFNFGEDFSRQSTQAIDNYDNFHQTIMDLEASQIEDPVYQAPQPANHYGATKEETCSQCFTPLTCN